MKIEDLKDKKIAILGLGMEGLSLVSFLDGKVNEITLLDGAKEGELLKKAKDNDELGAILGKNYKKILGDAYLDSLNDYDVIFRSPGVRVLEPKIQEAKNNGIEISSQIKLFFNLSPANIIGVTGTKGKGTTSSLINSMMSGMSGNVYLAGNIGKPAIILLDKLKTDDWAILELSSFQLQDLKMSPHISIITNITVDHLDYHKDEEEYVAAKESIAKYQKQDDTIIVNKDHKSAIDISEMSKGRRLYFSGKSECDAYIKDNKVFVDIDNKPVEISSSDNINLVGRHNLENIAAAALASIVAGVDIESIKRGAKEFKGLPHRLELVEDKNNKKFFNDSFATNPEPTIAAIKSFKEPITIILGGSSKGAIFSGLTDEIVRSSVENVILIGDEAQKIKSSLMSSGYAKNIFKVQGDMQDFVNKANEVSGSGSVVLLSPACASFGIFDNYKERGHKFVEAVKSLN